MPFSSLFALATAISKPLLLLLPSFPSNCKVRASIAPPASPCNCNLRAGPIVNCFSSKPTSGHYRSKAAWSRRAIFSIIHHCNLWPSTVKLFLAVSFGTFTSNLVTVSRHPNLNCYFCLQFCRESPRGAALGLLFEVTDDLFRTLRAMLRQSVFSCLAPWAEMSMVQITGFDSNYLRWNLFSGLKRRQLLTFIRL